MKLKLLIIFILAFVLIFAVLNSRFVYANMRFWLLTGTRPSTFDGAQKNQPKKSGLPKPVELPNKAQLVIDKLGVSAPIVFGASNNTDDIYKNLENGVVHYSQTPKPGAGGISIVLGHSSAYPWYKGHYGSVFALLGKLKPGDNFYVQYENGQTFTYSVKQSLVFSPFKKDDRLSQIENDSYQSLVLVSCWPVGTNYRRIAVQAEQI